MLVEQYVVGQGKRHSTRTGRYARHAGAIGFALLVAGISYVLLLQYVLDPTTSGWLLNPRFTTYPLQLTLGLGAVLVLASSGFSYGTTPVSEKKRKQVFDAMGQTNVSFKKAQRYIWIPVGLWLIGAIGLLVWALTDAGGWLQYYFERPSRLMLPVGVAAGVGIIAVVFTRVQNWLRRRRRA